MQEMLDVLSHMMKQDILFSIYCTMQLTPKQERGIEEYGMPSLFKRVELHELFIIIN